MEGNDPALSIRNMHDQPLVQPPELVGHYIVCGFLSFLNIYIYMLYEFLSC